MLIFFVCGSARGGPNPLYTTRNVPGTIPRLDIDLPFPMEERKQDGEPFRILSARNYARFHSTEFLVSIPYVMVDPVYDLRDVITEIGRRNIYNGNTIVTFSIKDDTGCSIFLNRIEGKPLLLQELYDNDTTTFCYIDQ